MVSLVWIVEGECRAPRAGPARGCGGTGGAVGCDVSRLRASHARRPSAAGADTGARANRRCVRFRD